MQSRKSLFRMPGTVDEAAELLISDLLIQHLHSLSSMSENEFDKLCEKVSPYLLEEFQIWNGNDQLLGSCFLQQQDDDPARTILKRFKKKLENFSGFLVIT